MKYQFTREQCAEIESARKANRDKRIDKRLQVLELRCEGKSLKEISSTTGFAISHISNLIRMYSEKGLNAVAGNHYHGNRRNMSEEEEAALLDRFQKKAEQGQVLDIRAIADTHPRFYLCNYVKLFLTNLEQIMSQLYYTSFSLGTQFTFLRLYHHIGFTVDQTFNQSVLTGIAPILYFERMRSKSKTADASAKSF